MRSSHLCTGWFQLRQYSPSVALFHQSCGGGGLGKGLSKGFKQGFEQGFEGFEGVSGMGGRGYRGGVGGGAARAHAPAGSSCCIRAPRVAPPSGGCSRV